MTAPELKAYIAAQLTAPVNTVIKIINSFNQVVDFITTEVADIMPLWTSGQTFDTTTSPYAKYEDPGGNLRLYETKVDGNIGNVPPTGTAPAEDTYWKEVSPSASAPIPEHAPGVFGPGLAIVFHNHSVDGRGLYVLLEPTRPFTSANIETEITGGQWEQIAGGSVAEHFRGAYTSLVNLQAAIPSGNIGDYAFVDAGVASDVQLYIWDNDDTDWILSGGGIVPDATPSVKGIAKLYATHTGDNTDGAMDQAITKQYVRTRIYLSQT